MNEREHNLDRQRNYSIDFFRLICALLVVAIHTNPLADQNASLSFFFCQVLSRIAVPFFFCISGYYFFQKLESGEKYTLNYLWKVLKLYFFWTGIYFIQDFILYFDDPSVPFGSFILSHILDFVFFGSCYHFWYFIGLFVSILIVGLFYRIKRKKMLVIISIILYGVGLLCVSYYFIGERIPGILIVLRMPYFTTFRRYFLMGLPFFVLGYLVARLKKLSKKTVMFALLLSILFFFVEIWAILRFENNGIVITGFLYFVLLFLIVFLIQHPLSSKYKYLSNKCKGLANFIFYIHPLFITIMGKVFSALEIKVLNIVTYFITVLLCIVCWSVLGLSNSSWIKRYVTG